MLFLNLIMLMLTMLMLMLMLIPVNRESFGRLYGAFGDRVAAVLIKSLLRKMLMLIMVPLMLMLMLIICIFIPIMEVDSTG